MRWKLVLSQVLLFLILLSGACYTAYNGYLLYTKSQEKNTLKSEYADINDITCGLFNVEIWSEHAFTIISKKISEFQLGKANKVLLKKEIENVLNKLLDEAEKALQEKKKGLKPRVKQALINAFVDVDSYRDKVPHFAGVIMKEVEKSLSKDDLKDMLRNKLIEYTSDVEFDDKYTALQDSILQKYNTTTVADCNRILIEKTSVLEKECQSHGGVVLYAIIGIMLGWLLVYKFPHLHGIYFSFCVLIAAICLVCGITSPMIEIDARIGELHFTLLGEHISFTDQVIFYRSKSILDVVRILMHTGKADSVGVGILILVFSIAFPVTKLICVIILAIFRDLKHNKFMSYMVFRSGKWSMADVFVVAIFMAYIGFNGILNDQLEDLNFSTESLSIITTNNTALEIGFSLFIAFCIFNLVISEILKRIMWKTRNWNRDLEAEKTTA